MVIVRLAYTAGGSGDSVDRGLGSGGSGGLSNTSRAVPDSSQLGARFVREDDLPVVVVRLTTYTCGSVCILGSDSRGKGENDSGNPHFDSWYV